MTQTLPSETEVLHLQVTVKSTTLCSIMVLQTGRKTIEFLYIEKQLKIAYKIGSLQLQNTKGRCRIKRRKEQGSALKVLHTKRSSK